MSDAAEKLDPSQDVPILEDMEKAPAVSLLTEEGLAEELALSKPSAESSEQAGVAMEKVRELLMGESVRGLRDDLHCSHRIILHRIETLHKNSTRRMDALDKKLSALKANLTQEVKDREASAEQATKGREKIQEDLMAEIQDLSASVASANDQLTSDLVRQASTQADALKAVEGALTAQLEQYCDELGTQKLNRDNLADLLHHVAGEISAPAEAKQAS